MTTKFAIGHLLVAGMATALPLVLESWAIPRHPSLVLTLGFCAGLGWVFSHYLIGGFRVLHVTTERISGGDLTCDVDLPQDRLLRDEMTDLARSVQGMLVKLRELVEHIQRAAEQVAGSTRELATKSRGVDATNRNIATIMERVGEGAVRQQEDLKTTEASIREITDAIRANSESAREAFNFVAEANHRATSGVEISRLSVAKMESLFERAEEAGQLVFRFDQKIRSVHRITEMINSVAEKTHLLSLNASIEAARAGDAGRGFSVVAEEIRRLAESAAASVAQIEDLVRQLEDESAHIADAMRQVGEGVGAGREDLDTIQGSLEQIKDAVQQASRRAEAIFHQAEGSANRAGHVVQEFDEIAKVASQNVESTDEMRSGLAIQTDGIHEMVRHVEQLFETSDRLEEVAQRFRTRKADD